MGRLASGVAMPAHYCEKALPPVSSGDRISAAGRLRRERLLDRAVDDEGDLVEALMVWLSMPSASSTGRIVRQTIAWPRLNSPSVPRSETIISSGIWHGTTSEASDVGERRKAARLHQHGAAQARHPGAGDDADRLLLARRREGGEEAVLVHALDQAASAPGPARKGRAGRRSASASRARPRARASARRRPRSSAPPLPCRASE